MRLPIASPLVSRDGSANKDARLTNMLKEVDSGRELAVVRPGLEYAATGTGAGGGLVAFNNELISVYGTTLGNVTSSFSPQITTGSMPSTSNWRLPKFNSDLNIFAAIANQSDEAAWSSDGVSWNAVTLPVSDFWGGMAYGNGVFCATCESGSQCSVITSSDGITWDLQSATVGPAYGLAFGNGVFCCVSGDTSYVSSDGITWNTYTDAGNLLTQFSITFGAGVFCAVGELSLGVGGASISSDGQTWSSVEIGGGVESWASVAWNGSMFLAVPNSTPMDTYATSTDGVTWTIRAFPISAVFQTVTASSDGVFLVSEYVGNTMLASSNGINWNEFSSGLTWGVDCASDGTGFCAVESANNGACAYIVLTGLASSITPISTIQSGIYDFAQSPL